MQQIRSLIIGTLLVLVPAGTIAALFAAGLR
jgi:hypothetical protein